MIEQYVAGAAISAAPVAAYWLFYKRLGQRPRLLSALLGAVPVSIAAIFLELAAFSYIDVFMGLIVASPLIEEVLKFAAARHGRDTAAGLGVGLGFALAENALYFGAFLQSHYSILYLLGFILMRGATDPVLHSFTASTSVGTWQTGKIRFLVLAVLLHSLYNLMAFAGGSNLSVLLPGTGVAALLMLVGSVMSMRPGRSRGGQGTPPAEYTTYVDGSRWCSKCGTAIGAYVNIAAHEHSEPHMSASRPPYAMAADPEKADEAAPVPPARDTQAALPATPLQIADWTNLAVETLGFPAVVKALRPEEGYQRTSWIRRSTYQRDGGTAFYWEVGRKGAAALATTAAVLVFVLWLVFA